jgi:hypothetical protein
MLPEPTEMKLGHRIALTFFIVLVILFAMAAFGYFTGGWDAVGAAKDAHPYEDPPLQPKYEAQLLELDRAAVDSAYTEHIKLVFGVWMKGPSDPGAPKRAGVGARNARDGYVISMEAIERREKRLKELQK